MAANVTGSVAVEVVPDARNWAARVRAQILGDADRIGVEWGKSFGAAASRAIGDSIEVGPRLINGGPPSCRVAINFSESLVASSPWLACSWSQKSNALAFSWNTAWTASAVADWNS